MNVLLSDEDDDSITPITESILRSHSLQYDSLVAHRLGMIDSEHTLGVVVVSPGPPDQDDDDDEELVMDDDDDVDVEEDRLDSASLELHGNKSADPDLLSQMLTNIQARLKNFEEILIDLRCQFTDMHQRDEDILKRMANLNDDIAELSLLESYDTSSRSAATGGGVGCSSDNYPDNYSDYGADH